MLKQYDEAVTDYTAAIKAKPDDVGNYRDRALAYEATKKTDEAIADWGEVIKRVPDNVVAHNRRGFLYASKDDYTKAIPDFDAFAAIAYSHLR